MHIRVSPGAVGWVAAGLVHLLSRTVRVLPPEGGTSRAPLPPRGEPTLYAFWHGRILLGTMVQIGSGMAVPMSRHRDGEYVARMAQHLGIRPVRGSTRRGGAQALKEMVRTLEQSHVAVTPDGPRGPRYVAQAGIIHLARLSGRPIVPVALEASPAWTAPSWDAFVVPLPFSRMAVRVGGEIQVPRHADDADVERLRRHLDGEMQRLSAEARQVLRRE